MSFLLGYKTSIVTKLFSDFSDAGSTHDVEILLLPTGARLINAFARVTAKFEGGTIATYTISLGISGDHVKYMLALDAKTAITDFIATANKGLGLTAPSGDNIESFSASTSIRAYATSTGDTLDHATSGSIVFYVEYFDPSF